MMDELTQNECNSASANQAICNHRGSVVGKSKRPIEALDSECYPFQMDSECDEGFIRFEVV
jgi:hypothetical protein